MDKEKVPIIIDCDPGHDDAIALVIALASERLDVLAVTCVAGNQTLDKTANNARKVLTFLERRVPVAKGADRPLIRTLRTAGEVHGTTGLDGPELEEADFDYEKETAWELQRRLILESETKVTVVAVGPLTNIATLLRAFPYVKEKIEKIVIMGGGLNNGNTTPMAEFNILVDPEAAHIVFNAGIPLVMCGLDITEKSFIMPDEVEYLRKNCKRTGTFVAELMSFYSKYNIALGFPGGHVHDACAIAYLIQPEMFKTEDMYVTVETEGRYTTGMTVADRRFNPKTQIENNPSAALVPRAKEPNVRVCMDIDRKALIELLEQSCISYGE